MIKNATKVWMLMVFASLFGAERLWPPFPDSGDGDETDANGVRWVKELRGRGNRPLLPEERLRIMQLSHLPIEVAIQKVVGLIYRVDEDLELEKAATDALTAIPGWKEYFKAELARECQKGEIPEAIRSLANEAYSRPGLGQVTDEEILICRKAQAEAQRARDRMGRYMKLLIHVKKPEAVAIMAPYSFYPAQKWEPRPEVGGLLTVHDLAYIAIDCLRRWGIESQASKGGWQKWWTENAHKYGADPNDIPWKQAQVTGETKRSPSPVLPPGNEPRLEKAPTPIVAGRAARPEPTPPPSPVLEPVGSRWTTRAFVLSGVAAIGILSILWQVLKRHGRRG